MTARYVLGFALVVLLGVGILRVSPGQGSRQALPADETAAIQLQQIRNLGKAFYENPATQQQAPEELRKAVELNPQSAQDHLNYGLALLRAGSVAEGIAELERARELDPAMPHTYFNLGIEYKKLGEAERAVTELEQMAKLVPGEAKTHYNLGVLYRQLDRAAEARAAFERAAELDPAWPRPTTNSPTCCGAMTRRGRARS